MSSRRSRRSFYTSDRENFKLGFVPFLILGSFGFLAIKTSSSSCLIWILICLVFGMISGLSAIIKNNDDSLATFLFGDFFGLSDSEEDSSPAEAAPRWEELDPHFERSWKCRGCGMQQSNESKICSQCGTLKTDSVSRLESTRAKMKSRQEALQNMTDGNASKESTIETELQKYSLKAATAQGSSESLQQTSKEAELKIYKEFLADGIISEAEYAAKEAELNS